MKKIFTLLGISILFLNVLFGQAENYKAFKVDLGMGYAAGMGDLDGGLLWYLEPKYNLTDNIAVGVKLEQAALVAVANGKTAVLAVATYQLTGDYYFGDAKVRFFGGLGMGMYGLASVSIEDSQGNVETVDIGGESVFGLSPRVGVLLGHFRLGLEYNLIFAEIVNPNYLGIKLGFEIGGGKK